MVHKRYLIIFLAILTLACWAPASSANLLSNGSFESSDLTTSGLNQSYYTLASGSTDISGWTVGGSGLSIDYIGTYWKAEDGTRSIDLDGTAGTGHTNSNQEASISQTFVVKSNTTYKVTFWYSGNPDGGPTPKTGVAQVGNFSATFSAPSQFWSTPNLYWQSESFTFTTGNQQFATLIFSSTTSGQYGPVIDNVSVDAVPLPPSVMLLGSGLMGLGLLGWRRRSS